MPFTKFDRAEIEQSIPARFEQQVKRHPHKLALKDKVQSFTYAELNGRASRLAWAIVEAIGPEPAPVAFLLDQSSAAVVAILGILSAGKFYVPLDPQDPLARNAEVLAEVQTRLIITDRHYLGLARQLTGPNQKVLCLESLDPRLSDENPDLSLGPDSLAYIFFTSGSTGRPKGVLDNHRNVLHNVMRYTNSLRIRSEDRLSLVQTPSFSGTVSSLFGALLNGAVICPYNLRQGGIGGMAAWLNETGVSIYHSVPTIFRGFLGDQAQFPSVRLIRLEGDRASRLDAELYRQHFGPNCILVNGLGTTETGLCRQYFINRQSRVTDNAMPIGYPVTDMGVVLLDDANKEVDVGQPGQIAVKSRYLSLGYWQHPELTAASFVPDPQGGDARTYLTGDMGRIRADGCLEYLGRKNSQLKVRGQSVEPADVESALLGLSFIREAAVITYEDRRGEAQLFAYVGCPADAVPTVVEIRRLLRQHLPDVLIPTGYRFMSRLPVNSSGKVDRLRLPVPEVSQSVSANTYTAPRTALEGAVSEVWAEVFTLDRVGLDDDFLALGGDSLKAMQILSRLRLQLGVELSFSTLFKNPRLSDLAEQIGQELRGS